MKNILIVDDSRTARVIARRCLEILISSNCQFHEAENGEEALSIIRGTPVDLVITDLNMPVMDGETLLRWIKGSPKTHDTPVVVISSIGNPAKEQKVKELGALTIITKPISPEVLQESMGPLLSAWGRRQSLSHGK